MRVQKGLPVSDYERGFGNGFAVATVVATLIGALVAWVVRT